MIYTPKSWIYNEEISMFCQVWAEVEEKSVLEQIFLLQKAIKDTENTELIQAIEQLIQQRKHLLINTFHTKKEQYHAYLDRLKRQESNLTSYIRSKYIYTGSIEDIQRSIDMYEELRKVQEYLSTQTNQIMENLVSPYAQAFDMLKQAYENTKRVQITERTFLEKKARIWRALNQYQFLARKPLPKK